jgi:molecular chaperone GrpE
MAEPRTRTVPEREDPQPAQEEHIDQEPPNVTRAEPPAEAIVRPPEPEEEARQIEEDLEAARRDFSALSDRHLRLAAEFDNYRKRIERERAESWTRAQADLAMRLLDALDDLERVAHHADSTAPDSLVEGVQLVERKLRQALSAAGLEPIEAEGEPFDPNSMEALATVETGSAAEDGLVHDVFQRGYSFKGVLLRPARVRVRKHEA